VIFHLVLVFLISYTMDLLAKLKSKTAADVGARLAAEKQNSVEGTVLVHLEKRTVHASDLERDLGIVLNDQAEVRSVQPGSEAAANRVPVDHLLYAVNGAPCRSLGDVEVEVAKPVLGIDLKLFPLAPLKDLLVQYQQLPASEDLKFEVLQRVPRYGFLQLFHPANHAWRRMYEQEREARRLRFNLQRQLEAKKEEEAMRHLAMLDVVSDEEPVSEAPPPVAPPAPSQPQPAAPPAQPRPSNFMRTSAPAAMFQSAGSVVEREAEPANDASEDEAAMLRQMIVESAVPDAATLYGEEQQAEPPVVIEEAVRYQLTPSKAYTLSTGEQVSIPVTTRSGPVPRPPSAPMPQMTMDELRRRDKRGREDEREERPVPQGNGQRGGRHEGGGHRGGGGRHRRRR
jgi:hypothetical protein